MSASAAKSRLRTSRESAAALLDAEVSVEYLAEQARRYAQHKTAHRPGSNSVVVFRLVTEWFALPTAVFSEISPLRPVHSLPHRGAVLAGVTNVRGELLVCVSLATALGLSTNAGQNPNARLAVISREGERFVFATDEIAGVHHYDDVELSPAPGTLAHARVTSTRGVLTRNGRAIGVLDAELLFYALNRSLT